MKEMVTKLSQRSIISTGLLLAVLLQCPVVGYAQTTQPIDPAKIEQITGAKPAFNKVDNVYKVTFPRNDVKITVDGTTMPPFMGLTSWAGFQSGVTKEAMVMGDIVLFQDEVNPAMSAALDNGLTVTALHNHFFYDDPKVYFMHIGGEGTTEQLAGGVRKVMDKIKEIRTASPEPAKGFGFGPLASKSSITPAAIDAALGHPGQAKDGMYKVTVGRSTQMPCGCSVGQDMGVNTWAAFYGTDDHALVDGDFATFDGELQPVLKSLRASGINIVAIHTHMETETPRVIFLHYWGVGSTAELGKALKGAMELQQAPEADHAKAK